jgi:hypothetical protein
MNSCDGISWVYLLLTPEGIRNICHVPVELPLHILFTVTRSFVKQTADPKKMQSIIHRPSVACDSATSRFR